MTGSISSVNAASLDLLGAPGVRGICYSCDAATGLEVAESVAENVGSAATWYSVGLLHRDHELSAAFAEFCARRNLRALFHPIDLDLCGTDPLDGYLLKELAARADELQTPWLNADLAMWCLGGEALLESLVPMPLVAEAVSWTADRVKQAQDIFQRPVAIENAPYPFIVGDGDILQLMTAIAEAADCLMTIDIGHLYGLRTQLGQPGVKDSDDDIAWERVVEAHMSGTFVRHFEPDIIVVDDKHDWPVSDEVWNLGLRVLPRAPNLRAVMSEAEGMSVEELSSSITRFDQQSHHWWGS